MPNSQDKMRLTNGRFNAGGVSERDLLKILKWAFVGADEKGMKVWMFVLAGLLGFATASAESSGLVLRGFVEARAEVHFARQGDIFVPRNLSSQGMTMKIMTDDSFSVVQVSAP